uniref:Uncharacterized protein n=1 Tax=Rhizophora mucronata TaxID=61149 RepID=A0A2P2NUL9_RHIMU
MIAPAKRGFKKRGYCCHLMFPTLWSKFRYREKVKMKNTT